MLRQRRRWSTRALASTVVLTALFSECYGQTRSGGEKPPIRSPLILSDPEVKAPAANASLDEEPPRLKSFAGSPASTAEKTKPPMLLVGIADGEESKTIVERAADKAITVPTKLDHVRGPKATSPVPLIWEIANAAQSQLSPYFLQLASRPIAESAIEVPAIEELVELKNPIETAPPAESSPQKNIPTDATLTGTSSALLVESDEDDPGLPAVDETKLEDLSKKEGIQSPSEIGAPAPSTSPLPTESPSLTPGTKRPRAIKIPFDNSIDDSASNESAPSPLKRNQQLKEDDSRKQTRSTDLRSAKFQW